jgi:hypothetical protein
MAPGPRVGKKWLAKNNIDFYFYRRKRKTITKVLEEILKK